MSNLEWICIFVSALGFMAACALMILSWLAKASVDYEQDLYGNPVDKHSDRIDELAEADSEKEAEA